MFINIVLHSVNFYRNRKFMSVVDSLSAAKFFFSIQQSLNIVTSLLFCD